jgi:hypothetical protein
LGLLPFVVETMNYSTGPAEILSLVAGNVLPQRKSSSFAHLTTQGIQVFSPDSINLHEAASDFNCVVELSADFCLRVFDFDFQRTFMGLVISPIDLKTFFASQTTPFDSPYLNQLAATDPTKPTYFNGIELQPKGLSLLLTFTPSALSFGSGQSVAITYQVSVAVGSLYPPEKGETLGQLAVTIDASWLSAQNGTLKLLDIYADLSAASVSVMPSPSDAKRLYDGGLFGVNGSKIQTFVLYKHQVHLVPTISLVGKDNPVNVPVPELSAFNAQVSVVSWLARQALAVGFTVTSNCSPAIEDVEHFIGFSDYGVVSDEVVVAALLHHKWLLGKFSRQFPLHTPIQVQINNQVENATLFGILQLETLDFVQMSTNSNAGSDVLTFGGNSEAVPQYIVLPDNTIVTPQNSNVNFGPTSKMNWAVTASPSVQAPLPTIALSRTFTLQAYQDAYRHIARPFANFPDSPGGNALEPLHATYVRTSAIARRIFSLVNVSQAFV